MNTYGQIKLGFKMGKLSIICCLFILFCRASLFSDQELIDDDIILNPELHFYEIQEEISESTEQISFSAQNYLRFSENKNLYHNKNRLQIKYQEVDFKIIHENNLQSDKYNKPFGLSLSLKKEYFVGQYQIEHGYGVLLSKGAFISQKPGFNYSINDHQSRVFSNARPYYSRSFMGLAWEKKISAKWKTILFFSYKDLAARTENKKIISFQFDSPTPEQTELSILHGGIIQYQSPNWRLNTLVYYNYTELEYHKTPVSASVVASMQIQDYLLFTEIASSNAQLALLSGFRNRQQGFEQSLVYRRLSERYQADYANMISNSANQTNEEGLFYQVNYRIKAYWLSTFIDFFQNIEPLERYSAKNKGTYVGIKIEKFGLFSIDDMNLSISWREKTDKEWRNLSGISKYENRQHDYVNIGWQQTASKIFRTNLSLDYQKRNYRAYELANKGIAITQSLELNFQKTKFAWKIGFFDTTIPLYLYRYNGRLNNPLLVLSGEGQYSLLHITKQISQNINLESMISVLKNESTEYNMSVLLSSKF